MKTITQLDLDWLGPYSWPEIDVVGTRSLDADPKVWTSTGVYLWTFEYMEGYVIYCAGITTRSFKARFKQHRREFRRGVYTVFDPSAMSCGERKKIWPGFWYRKRTEAMLNEWTVRHSEIEAATAKLLSAYRLFIACTDANRRMLERIEAAVMAALYAAPAPISSVPDRGMHLAPQWPEEPVITIANRRSCHLYGLPDVMEA